MKRKLMLLFACILTASMLFGCGNTSNETTTENTPTQEQTEGTSSNAQAPSTEELMTLYQNAHDLYQQIVLTGFELSTTDVIDENGLTYYRVLDERFQDMPAFRTYLNQYFTNAFIDSDILAEDNVRFTEGKGGGLYALDGSRGSNIYYAGYAMAEPVVSEDSITLTATAYYTEGEAYSGETFREAPADADAYTTREYTFTLVSKDGQWKFDTFDLFY